MRVATNKSGSVVTITVRRVKDSRKTRGFRKSYGKRSGMGFQEYIATLLKGNELLQPNRKMTDAAMVQALVNEFPGRKGVESLRLGRITLNHYRSLYNCGKLFEGRNAEGVPEIQSRRFVEVDGVMYVADSRTGKPIEPVT
jgi:hypothetical protein